ncbi:LysR family transcriptional regulator [SAR92 clade bacterium H231]|jgi:DNA-binding transcriptional LysR family regulator|nr:LysR family transcriptional regulator [Porticoccaceae bacterium]MCT2532297.1 LysR family transcriptional regulator [SAR92 clade bacterium H231]MDA8978733.1 LysR family transcriptional regulator [bacterium]MBT6318763.1 LysR family transcriptional regulator [Porticoccaceae bacterium]MBT7258540.1 LysR family transcriptional regulator [Porticoccaceae bacterium]
MNISRVDLNLLVYLDVLLRECNVTRAAEELGISQPAMSNSLRRLRDLFGDPILVRTSDGMTPTDRALELQPMVRKVLSAAEQAILPKTEFNPMESSRIFRIMASDYTESTLLPVLLRELRKQAPNIRLDIMTPSDVSFHDVERGKVDMVINRFDSLPQSFHQVHLWDDSFSCVMSSNNPVKDNWNLQSYLSSKHIWVSKTGMGVGVGMTPDDVQRLGWVDEALSKQGVKRDISLFTRHYQVALLLAEQDDLIVTIPSMSAKSIAGSDRVVILEPPFEIERMRLKMVWSPLLQHDPGHKWLRQLIKSVSVELLK